MEVGSCSNLVISIISLTITSLTLLLLWWTLKETKRIAQASLDQTEYLTRPVLGIECPKYIHKDEDDFLRTSDAGFIFLTVKNHSRVDTVGLLHVRFVNSEGVYKIPDEGLNGEKRFFFCAESNLRFKINLDDIKWGDPFPFPPSALEIDVTVFYKSWSPFAKERNKSKRYFSPVRTFLYMHKDKCTELPARKLSIEDFSPNWKLLEDD